MNNKQLRRFQHDSVVGGVAAGLADCLGMDKALVRFIFVILFFFTKGIPVVLVYIILWIALPKADYNLENKWTYPAADFTKTPSPFSFDSSRSTQIIGYGLLAVGGFWLFDDLFHWIHIGRFLPAAALIGLGGYLIWRSSHKKDTAPDTTVYTAPAETPKAEPSVFDETPTQSKPSIFDDPEEPKQ